MKLLEQVKIFSGGDTDTVEKQFNKWRITMEEEKNKAPKLRNHPFNILHRDFVIRNYKGEETFALVIHYEKVFLDPHEIGEDRVGAGRDIGVSMVRKN
jgi:hypothetical protein